MTDVAEESVRGTNSNVYRDINAQTGCIIAEW